MSFLRRGHDRVYDWFYGEADLTPLILCRWICGLTLAIYYTYVIPSAHALYWPDGIPTPPYQLASEHHLFFVPLDRLSQIPSGMLAGALLAAVVASSLFFALGIRTRMTGLIVLVLHSLLEARAPYSFGSWSLVLKSMILYLILASPDRRCWRGPAWPLRLMQVQVCAIYLAAAWPRFGMFGWDRGEMAWYALVQTQYGRINYDWIPFRPVLRALSYVAWGIESAAPIALWLPWARTAVLFGLISFHLSIELFTTVGAWSVVMLAGLCCFLPPSALEAIQRALRSGFGSRIIAPWKGDSAT